MLIMLAYENVFNFFLLGNHILKQNMCVNNYKSNRNVLFITIASSYWIFNIYPVLSLLLIMSIVVFSLFTPFSFIFKLLDSLITLTIGTYLLGQHSWDQCKKIK